MEDPGFQVYELITGPMNAGIFPTTSFDPTLGPERLFLYAPPWAAAVASWAEAKHWFNFGAITIARDGALSARIVNTEGTAVDALRLGPSS